MNALAIGTKDGAFNVKLKWYQLRNEAWASGSYGIREWRTPFLPIGFLLDIVPRRRAQELDGWVFVVELNAQKPAIL